MKTRLAASLFLLTCFLSASHAPAQVKPAGRVRVSDSVMQGLLVKKVSPIYPPLARQVRIQGTVILKIGVSKLGDVQNIELISGHPMLAPAAVEAVKQWKYKPFLVNGEPMEVETNAIVNFTLSDKPPEDGTVGDLPGGFPAGEQGGIAPSAPDNPIHPAVPQRIRVSSGVAQRLLRTKINPEYPPDARQQHIQGNVLLKVNIDKEGNLYKAELISGHPLLAPSAIEAVKQWKYKPYLLNGTAVEVETEVRVAFTLAAD